MRARLIVNPASGTDRGVSLLPHISARLSTLARDLDITITGDEADAARTAVRAVEEGCRALDVAGGDGTMNDSPFVNTSAGGFVADVSDAVTETLKDRAGKLAYLIGGARALLGSEALSVRFVSTTESAAPAWTDDDELQMFAVCNAPMIGGGYAIAPDALIDDGQLDVLMVRRMPLLEFVGARRVRGAPPRGEVLLRRDPSRQRRAASPRAVMAR